MKKKLMKNISVFLFLAVIMPFFGLSCFEGAKDDSSSETWALLSMLDSMSGDIRVYNESSYQIDIVYIAPATNPSAGNDMLYGIIYGDEYEIFRKLQGNYYVFVADSRYNGGWEFTSVPVTAGETSSLTCYD